MSSTWKFFWRVGQQVPGFLTFHLSKLATGRPLPIWPCYVTMSLIIYETLHSLGKVFLNKNHTFTRLLNYDPTLFLGVDCEINLVAAAFGLCAGIFYYRLHWHTDSRRSSHKLYSLIYQIIYQQKTASLPSNLVYRDPSFQVLVPVTTFLSWNMFKLTIFQYNFLYTQISMAAIFQCIFAWFIFQDWPFYLLNPIGALSLLGMLVHSAIFCFYIVYVSLINLIMTVLFTQITWIAFIRLRQVNAALSRARKLTGSTLERFMRLHTETLSIIFSSNRLFAPLLLVFLVVDVPVNSFLFHTILSGKYGLVANGCFVNLLIAQVMVIIGVHLLAALYTAKIHRCAKALLHWEPRAGRDKGARKLSFGQHLRLVDYIFKFHIEKAYGINYGTIGGLISLFSFFKFIFLYGELLIYWQRLMN